MSGERCSLRHCIQGELVGGMAQVHVRGYDIKEEDSAHMEVSWSRSGEAKFHDICWKAVMNSVKMDNPFVLCDRERDLLIVAKKTAEYFDSHDKITTEAERIANMIASAKYAVAFTGAGISTAAGVGDFRGKCGKWTEKEKTKVYGSGRTTKPQEVDFEALRPTYTHEALAYLLELGFIKHIISQNTDGLHRMSGIPRDNISELHGNLFHERCDKCGTRYERGHAVRPPCSQAVTSKACVHCHFDHSTGAVCEKKGCDGILMNCIINFGDSLEKKVLATAADHARKSDLMLCLGSTLRVAPACDLVEMGLSPLRLIICNRQPTLMDRLCYMGRRGDHTLLKPSLTNNTPSLQQQTKSSQSNDSKQTLSNQSEKQTQQITSNKTDKVNLTLNSYQSDGLNNVQYSNSNQSEQATQIHDAQNNDVAWHSVLGRAVLPVGARVFGDCDDLMRGVMSHVLTTQQMRDWMGGVTERQETYNKQRCLTRDDSAIQISKF